MTQSLVLVVDDEEDNRVLLRAMLQHAGMAVVLASGGVEALEMARAHSPTLVLMDLHMAHVDGFQAARMLGEDPATRRIPIIAVTADALVAEGELEQAGFCGIIRLPEMPSRIVESVRWCLDAKLQARAWNHLPGNRRGSGAEEE
jgi:CheY-like chemotaxis protein